MKLKKWNLIIRDEYTCKMSIKAIFDATTRVPPNEHSYRQSGPQE